MTDASLEAWRSVERLDIVTRQRRGPCLRSRATCSYSFLYPIGPGGCRNLVVAVAVAVVVAVAVTAVKGEVGTNSEEVK